MLQYSLIQIYTQQNCPDCTRAKLFFEAQSTPFQLIDITHDIQTKKYVMFELGVYTTPVIVIGKNIFAGFQEKEIQAILQKEK